MGWYQRRVHGDCFFSYLRMFEKEVVIDGRGHLVGRLAFKVAHELLNGQRVVVVRCEALNLSGSLFRNKLNRQDVVRKANNTNPRRNFKHPHSPSRLFWKSLRGMLPHKSPKGKAALARLKFFEGIPFPYDGKKRMVVPEALKCLRLKSHRRFCVLGDLSALFGWEKQGLLADLEEKRKAKCAKYHENKQKKLAAKAKNADSGAVKKLTAELKQYGF